MVTEKDINNKYAIPEDVDSLYGEALSAIKQKRYDEARRFLFRILDKYSEHPRVLNALAATYRFEGKYEKAEDCFFRAITAYPDYVYAYSNLSLMYSEMGEIEKAGEYARRSVTILRESAIPWHTLGIYYLTRGQLLTAIDHFLAAYSYDPTYKKAAYNAACCYALVGEIDEALDYLKKSLDSPERIARAEEDEDFADIRDLPEFKRIIEEARKSFRKK